MKAKVNSKGGKTPLPPTDKAFTEKPRTRQILVSVQDSVDRIRSGISVGYGRAAHLWGS